MSIMNASVSGMNADTSWLSGISQNIANANTTGYKNAETQFSTLVDQASATSYNGAGVTTNTTSMNSMQGTVVGGQSAVTDLAVQGNGYFVVSNSAGETFLTRDGSFVPDASGNLVNSDGYYLMGYDIQNGPPNIVSNSLTGMQNVNVDQAGEQAVATTSGTFTANLPSTATAVAAADLPSTNAADAQYTEETSVVAYNDLGGSQTINLYMTKTGDNSWEVAAYDNSAAASGGGFPYSSGPLATETLNFDPTTGQLASVATGTGAAATTSATDLSLSIPVPNGQTMSLNLSGMSQLAGAYNVSASSVNGNAPSSVTGVTIGTDGTLSFQFGNGQTVAGYLIPLANVSSPDNLTSVNGNAFQANGASGAATVGTAGTAGFGSIASSSLESSTVDLATELTQMIEAQSAYEANSKVFQTGADILDVLNNLKS
jgi:flagellar hook protein FlgE